jgi:hypothetical protein
LERGEEGCEMENLRVGMPESIKSSYLLIAAVNKSPKGLGA